MRCLVTGGAGFIGSHIAQHLVEEGHDVIVIDDLSGGSLYNLEGWWIPEQCRILQADVAKYDHIESFFKGIDTVFHNAAAKCVVCMEDPLRDLMTNAWGAKNVIEASLKHGVRKIVHASTGSVNNFKPKSFYGVSKMAAEGYYSANAALYPELNYTILRYHHVFGERQSTVGVIPKFVTNIVNGEPITIQGGDQRRRFTYVGDVVKANMIAMNLPSGGVYPVLSDTDITIGGLVVDVTKLMPSKKITVQYDKYRDNEIMEFPVDNGSMKAHGLVYSDYMESLEKTVRWYEENPH